MFSFAVNWHQMWITSEENIGNMCRKDLKSNMVKRTQMLQKHEGDTLTLMLAGRELMAALLMWTDKMFLMKYQD